MYVCMYSYIFSDEYGSIRTSEICVHEVRVGRRERRRERVRTPTILLHPAMQKIMECRQIYLERSNPHPTYTRRYRLYIHNIYTYIHTYTWFKEIFLHQINKQ